MILKVHSVTNAGGNVVPMRCPACRHQGLMQPVGGDQYIGNNIVVGHRKCPSADCSTHVFVILDQGSLLRSYPAELIDFDPANVPRKVVAAFEEALQCQSAQCYTAAAIMLRRTLEELCADQDAEGGNLKAKIADLRKQIVLPSGLLEAMDELRILGNDAAHVEAKEYTGISNDEILLGIECTKEIIKGIYQLSSLVGRLRGLKNKALPTPPASSSGGGASIASTGGRIGG